MYMGSPTEVVAGGVGCSAMPGFAFKRSVVVQCSRSPMQTVPPMVVCGIDRTAAVPILNCILAPLHHERPSKPILYYWCIVCNWGIVLTPCALLTCSGSVVRSDAIFFGTRAQLQR